MPDNGNPNERGQVEQVKWHESVTAMSRLVVFGLIVTSPCWGITLIALIVALVLAVK